MQTQTLLFLLNIIGALLNILFVAFVLFFERKDSPKRVLWLVILLFLPVIGMILYVLFSGHFFTGTKKMQQANEEMNAQLKPFLVEQKNIFNEELSHLSPSLKEFHQLAEMNLSKGDSLLLSTDSVQFFTNGKDFFDSLCSELENAQKSIYMEYFIFKEDKIGKRISEILCRKAQEGVEVKILYDDLGSLFTRRIFFRRIDKAGGQTRPFFQIRLGLPLTLNYRNHRKLTIIDSKIAYTGGINIGDEYANQNRHRKLNWRDTVVRMTGTSLFALHTSFFIDWYAMDSFHKKSIPLTQFQRTIPPEVVETITVAIKTNTERKLLASQFEKGHIPTQLILAGPDDAHKAEIEDTLIKMIMNAKKSVYIQTPYFTPDEGFLNALKLASYSGVDVRIMIPHEWDKFYMKAASYDYAREVLEKDVKILLYPGFIHAKTITVDGKICSVGTTNIDNRSFNLHFEQNVIFYDSKISREHENIFFEDEKISMKADKAYFSAKPVTVRAWWSFCRLFSPFM